MSDKNRCRHFNDAKSCKDCIIESLRANVDAFQIVRDDLADKLEKERAQNKVLLADCVKAEGQVAVLNAVKAKLEAQNKVLQAVVESTANFLRGLTLDPAIPPHAKAAIHAKIHQIEEVSDDTN